MISNTRCSIKSEHLLPVRFSNNKVINVEIRELFLHVHVGDGKSSCLPPLEDLILLVTEPMSNVEFGEKNAEVNNNNKIIIISETDHY